MPIQRLPGTGNILLLIGHTSADQQLAALLSEAGYQVSITHIANESAIKQLDQFKTELLIVDETGAQLAGHALCKLKRELQPLYLPLLLAMPAGKTAAPWLDCGFDDVLRLPLNQEDLRARLLVFFRLRKCSEDLVSESRASYQATFELAPVGILHADLDGNIQMSNRQSETMLGCCHPLAGRHLPDLVAPESRAALQAALDMLKSGHDHTPVPLDAELLCDDGHRLWAAITMTAVNGSAGTPRHLIALVEDKTARKRMEQELLESTQFIKATINALPEHICVLDENGRVIAFNQTWQDFGEQNGAPLQTDWTTMNYLDVCRNAAASGDESVLAFYEGLQEVLQGKRTEYAYEYPCHSLTEQRWFLCKVRRFQQEHPMRVLISHENITQVKRAEQELVYLAHYDSLTGLPNRVLFYERLRQGLQQSQRSGRASAIMFIDLDHFKLVNDTLGHAAGDKLLREAGRRISTCLRRNDTAGRLGGDEFCVLLVDLSSEQDAALVADKLTAALRRPFLVDGSEVFVTSSIGIALSPLDGTDPDMLVSGADTAMYRAKQTGRNNYQYFTAHMNETLQRRMKLENGLRRALEREELFLEYQPQVDIESGRIIGVEALMRWRHPELGLLSPTVFIPIAEETGQILAIGEWALMTACCQNKLWQQAGLPPVVMGVNISAHQLHHADLRNIVTATLQASGLEGHYLELEVTESIAMEQAESLIATMDALKSLGVRLSLDDFGTGYSNLSYLKRFPIDRIKMDRSYVSDVDRGEDGSMIAASVINLSRSLRLEVLAEGVETHGQLAVLRDLGCSVIQGYLLGYPAPGEVIQTQLAQQQHATPN